MSTDATSGGAQAPNPAPAGQQTGAGDGSASTAGGTSTSGQTIQLTEAELNAKLAAARKSAEAEASKREAKLKSELDAIKNSGKPIEEQLAAEKAEREKLAKEADELREWRKGWEERTASEIESRAKALPEHLRGAYDAAGDLPIDKRMEVLARLEKAASAHAGVNPPPGGNMGTRPVGIDLDAINADMARGDVKAYREAMKVLGKDKLDQELAKRRSLGSRR